MIIGCKEYANDDEVCVVNATFTDTDTNITYYTSKTLYVSKVLYNTFKIEFQFDDEEQERMITFNQNCLFSLGYLDTGEFNFIKFKTFLYGPSLATTNETKSVKIYEIGSSYFNIETLESGDINNPIYTKRISLNTVENIDGEKEVILLFVYNDPISGRSIVRPYSVKIFASLTSGDIKSIEIVCSSYVLNENDNKTYTVYGTTSTSERIDITNLCNIELRTPTSGTSLNTATNSIITTTFSSNAAGYIKATYNNLTTYVDIYFIKN